jgi:hypothetical protein
MVAPASDYDWRLLSIQKSMRLANHSSAVPLR